MASIQSSVAVAVRVRPFTALELSHLTKKQENKSFLGDGSLTSSEAEKENEGYSRLPKLNSKAVRKIVDVVDDRMLIFDPLETSPLATLSANIGNSKGKQLTRFREHRFIFDRLFDEKTSQKEVYDGTTRPLLDSVIDGFNATVFAYGATGCGKTHTINGTSEDPGIIYLTMAELFEKIEGLKDSKVFNVSLSYLEIYNETIRDLMVPETDPKLLNLREDSQNRIVVSNLSSHIPKSVHEVMDMIHIGNKNRTVSPTKANETSSRSHAVLQINISHKNRTAEVSEEHTFATLSIIDLAGSERAAATMNRGKRLHEGANINKSLLALGNCINALCDGKRRSHVPYRDSKLTRLLKFSLGGNCKTVMIVCISPSSLHYDETLNTLKYADRAKEIKTKVLRNKTNLDRHVGSYLKMISEQRIEIEELKNRESTKIEECLEEFRLKRSRVAAGILDLIESVKQNINSTKIEQIKLRKSLILCKRNISVQILNTLKSFNQHFASYEYFQGLLAKSEDLTGLFQEKVQELESLFNAESDIDHMMTKSVDNGVKRLSELETWSQSDKVQVEIMLSLIRDSIDKIILRNAAVAQDQATDSAELQFITGFSTSNCFKIFDVDPESSLDDFRENFIRSFENYLLDLSNFDSLFEELTLSRFQHNMKSEMVLPTSPVEVSGRTYKDLSPFNLSPDIARLNKLRNSIIGNSKISKNTPSSPTLNKIKQIKKVRWNFPDETDQDNSYDENQTKQSDVQLDRENDTNMDESMDTSDVNMDTLDDSQTLERDINGIKKLEPKQFNSLLTKSLLAPGAAANPFNRSIGKATRLGL
ncbi:hypothetical protein WICPIJ_006674 [Wickerhamomyces pijperi]|uniref:Kinesin-like protein n=1 Tax=Wickerhamomyces pijperi TaxID=599730 RepID=A0A9P8Q3K1_WICPI|nr:hypothetical protein WICPIJ_006674 [Wickerhamomyces pijperi]